MLVNEHPILIVEDDAAIARLMQLHLEAAGLTATCCDNGDVALGLLQEKTWRAVILDRMLPGAGGMRVLRFIRRNSEDMLPVLMVTALGQTADRIQGLNEGADDYLAKPFEPEELVARVQALLRRSDSKAEAALSHGSITLNADTYRVNVGDQHVILRPLEYRLLQILMKKPGKTRSRDYLLDHVWGRDTFVEPRTVDVTVKRLRKALKGCGVGDCVETIRSMGYRFNSEAA
ncbi:MAG: response regulator [Mariprofundaceae bacterium]